MSADLAGVLLAHQGPFWDGIHSRCGCRRILLGAQEWAEHLQEVLRSVNTDVAKQVLLDFFSNFEEDDAQCDNWAEVILANMRQAGVCLAAARSAETGADQ